MAGWARGDHGCWGAMEQKTGISAPEPGRVHEDTSKLYFAVVDYRGVTMHFAALNQRSITV